MKINTENTRITESIKAPLKPIAKKEIKQANPEPLLSYSEQKKIVDAHNAIAVAKWNSQYL